MDEVLETLFAASEALAPGELCPERCEHGGICCLDRGHDGLCEAHGFGGRLLCEWEAE